MHKKNKKSKTGEIFACQEKKACCSRKEKIGIQDIIRANQ